MSEPTGRRAPEILIPVLLGIGLSLLYFWPSWLSPLQTVPGSPSTDCWSHAFGLRWFANSLLDGSFPADARGLAFPRGGQFWYVDPIGAVVALPFLLLGGTGLGYHAELMAQVVLACVGGWRYARALGGSPWVGAVAVAAAPMVLAEYHNGILEAAWIGLVPLTAAAALAGSRLTGPLIGLATLATPYHGLAAAALAGWHLLRAGRWRGLLEAALLGALLGGGPLFLLNRTFSGEDRLEQKPSGIQEPTLRVNAMDPVAFVTPGDFWTVDLRDGHSPDFARTPYLGFGLLGLALVGLIRRPREAGTLLVVAAGAVAALGPYLWHDGDFVRTAAGERVALPLRYLLPILPVNLDHPLRLLSMSITGLAGLAAIGARGRAGPALAALIVAEALLVAPHRWPYDTCSMKVPAVYRALREAAPDDTRAVIDLPADHWDTGVTQRYLYWQAVHGRPIPYVLKVSGRGLPSFNPALRTWTGMSLTMPLAPGSPGSVDPAADLGAAVRELATQGFGYVVLHPELAVMPKERWFAAINPLLGEPRAVEGDWVWEIPR